MINQEIKRLIIDDPNLRHGFTQVPNLVLKDPLLTCTARVLYILLLAYAWQDKECWPGHERLAKDLGCSEATIIRTLAELKTHKLVTWTRPGQGRVNIYHIRRLTDGYIPKQMVDKARSLA